MLKTIIITAMMLAGAAIVNAQDTIKVLSYNPMNYGIEKGSCPNLITYDKHKYVREIIGFEKPDIVGLVKIDASNTLFAIDTVINQVFNPLCNGCYGHGRFTDNSGYSKE